MGQNTPRIRTRRRTHCCLTAWFDATPHGSPRGSVQTRAVGSTAGFDLVVDYDLANMFFTKLYNARVVFVARIFQGRDRHLSGFLCQANRYYTAEAKHREKNVLRSEVESSRASTRRLRIRKSFQIFEPSAICKLPT